MIGKGQLLKGKGPTAPNFTTALHMFGQVEGCPLQLRFPQGFFNMAKPARLRRSEHIGLPAPEETQEHVVLEAAWISMVMDVV